MRLGSLKAVTYTLVRNERSDVLGNNVRVGN